MSWRNRLAGVRRDDLRRLGVAVLIVATGLALIGCSRQSTQIIGKWESTEPRQTYEFRADGKYDYTGSGDVRRLFGSYRIQGSRVYLDAMMPSLGGQFEKRTSAYEFSVKDDILTIDSVEYKRVKQ
jgi:hypothetical protein